MVKKQEYNITCAEHRRSTSFYCKSTALCGNISADLSDYDNRYCVYWYRKDDAVTDDPIMEAGWQRLTPGMAIETNSAKTTMAMSHNLGLPTEFTNKGTTESPEYCLTASTKPEEGFLTVYLNPNKKEIKDFTIDDFELMDYPVITRLKYLDEHFLQIDGRHYGLAKLKAYLKD